MAKPEIRPAIVDDAALASDLMTAAYPPEPQDPIVTRYRWEHGREGWTFGRFMAELEGRAIAFLWTAHGPWDRVPERNCDVGADIDLAYQSDGMIDFLWTWITEHAVADGTRTINAYAAEDEPRLLAGLGRLGFRIDRSEKVWELDLEQHGKRLLTEAAAARDRMKKMDIELLPLAEWPGPETIRKLHELNEAARKDIPSSYPILPQTLADFTDRMRSPDLSYERLWIARHGDQPVAISFLRFPPVRGHVWTGFTCSDPEYRGRGIARAVKLQSLAQAIELGIPFVRTDNDSENVAMLRINEHLGYHSRPRFMSFVKRVDSP